MDGRRGEARSRRRTAAANGAGSAHTTHAAGDDKRSEACRVSCTVAERWPAWSRGRGAGRRSDTRCRIGGRPSAAVLAQCQRVSQEGRHRHPFVASLSVAALWLWRGVAGCDAAWLRAAPWRTAGRRSITPAGRLTPAASPPSSPRRVWLAQCGGGSDAEAEGVSAVGGGGRHSVWLDDDGAAAAAALRLRVEQRAGAREQGRAKEGEAGGVAAIGCCVPPRCAAVLRPAAGIWSTASSRN